MVVKHVCAARGRKFEMIAVGLQRPGHGSVDLQWHESMLRPQIFKSIPVPTTSARLLGGPYLSIRLDNLTIAEQQIIADGTWDFYNNDVIFDERPAKIPNPYRRSVVTCKPVDCL